MLQEVLNEETVDVTAELVESDEDLVENESQDIATSETRTTTIWVLSFYILFLKYSPKKKGRN